MDPILKDESLAIGVLSVATNIYLEYWKAMVLSAEGVTSVQDQVTFFVFTDDLASVDEFSQNLVNVKVRSFQIMPLVWPEATLLRYQIFSSHLEYLDSDLLVYLDADMIIKSNPWKLIKNRTLINSVCLVEHPGFWRPKGAKKIILYFFHPLLAWRDVKLKLKKGGIGAWETNIMSEAFVVKNKRIKYFCGGSWFGQRNAIVQLIETLAHAVQSDLNQNLIAVWHDESHLNKWASENPHGIETPELCFAENYPNLTKVKPIIVAVTKKDLTR